MENKEKYKRLSKLDGDKCFYCEYFLLEEFKNQTIGKCLDCKTKDAPIFFLGKFCCCCSYFKLAKNREIDQLEQLWFEKLKKNEKK